MRAQRTRRATALNGPYLATAITPRMVPVAPTAAPDLGNSTAVEKGRSAKKGKMVQQKKPVQRNKPAPKSEPATACSADEKRTTRRKRARKTPSSIAVTPGIPQLVTGEEAFVANLPEELLALSSVLAPVLVLPEVGPVESATLTSEIGSDEIEAAKPTLTECSVVAGEATALEQGAVPSETRQPLVQALAHQWMSLLRILTRGWNWAQNKLKSHQVRKRLRVCESVSLGDKRFIAVIQVDGEQFLVGGSSSSVCTLAHLERRREFSEVFKNRCEQDLSQA
jgi:flagellar biogenesis protein FliO